jgi:hypothetical protein
MLRGLVGGDLEGRVAQAMPTVSPNSLFAPYLRLGVAIRGVVVGGGGSWSRNTIVMQSSFDSRFVCLPSTTTIVEGRLHSFSYTRMYENDCKFKDKFKDCKFSGRGI